MTAEMIRIGETYQEVRDGLLGYIRSRLRTADDEAEEILQDVFLQAIAHVNVLDRVENLVGWLYRAATNKVIDWFRKRRLRTVDVMAADMGDRQSLSELVRQAGLDVHEEMQRHIVGQAIEEALQALPEPQRDAFVEQAILGRTFRSISEQNGVPINTLLSRKRAAVLELRSVLAEVKWMLDEPTGTQTQIIEEEKIDG